MGKDVLKVFEFVCVYAFLICVIVVSCKRWTGGTVERPVRIGAFNIQNLGQSKMNNKTVMDIVKKILLRYDLILVQEIVTTNETLMINLIQDINKMHKENSSKYDFQISERLGRGTAKEQYAYIYRTDKFRFLKGHTFPDTDDNFMRPPYIAHFSTPTLRDMDSMIAIGIHTQPKNAANETSALAEVYDYAVKAFKTKDAIIMGDMNAGCANVRISDWDIIELWKRHEFRWLITHDLDTTLSLNCCPYDRMVVAGKGMNEAIIDASVNIYKYTDIFSLSTEMALAVSDHWPIEVSLKGGTSEIAKENIKPTLCLTVHDARAQNLPAAIRSQKTTYGFGITNTDSSTELYAESTEHSGNTLLQSLQTLQAKYPKFVSTEALDTLLYKVQHGAIEDASSKDDLEEDFFSVLIHFDVEDSTTTIHYCTATTIN